MVKWLGKSGHGMQVMCVVLRHNDKEVVEKPYFVFISKAPLKMEKFLPFMKNAWSRWRLILPHKKFLVDKQDNA